MNLTPLVTALLIGAMAGPAAAMRPDRGPAAGIDTRVEHIIQILDVDDAQRERLRAVVDAHRPRLRSLSDQMRANRTALRELNPEVADFAARLDVLALEQGRLTTEMVRLRGDLRAAVAGILSAEQRTQLEEQGSERRRMRRPVH